MQEEIQQEKLARRDFFKQAGTWLLAPFVLSSFWRRLALAADKVPFVVPGQGMAASVNYTEDKSKVKKELQTDRQGVKFADQKCSACTLFTKDPAGNYGKCALFPGQFVKPTSWCSSWSKKA